MTQTALKRLHDCDKSVNIIPLRWNRFDPALRPHQQLKGYHGSALFDYGGGNVEIIVARHCGVISRHVKASPGLVCRDYQRW